MSYHRLSSLGQNFGAKYPWHEASPDTLALQAETNASLKAAGYCPIPSTGILDGTLCGARNLMTIKSREMFGKSMVFNVPDECEGHEEEWSNPTAGCYKRTGIPLSKKEWILIGGAVSAVLAAWLMVSSANK